MKDDIVRLTMDLVRCRSTADRPDESKRALEHLLSYLDVPGAIIERREFDGVPCGVVRPEGVERPRVILCGHLDVVPAEDRQFEPRLEGDRLHGRGTLDMKGGMAAAAAVFRATIGRGIPWWLVAVTDEETGGEQGAARLAAEGMAADLFVVVEPSEMTLSLQSKGALRVRLTARGRRAHASTPWLGESAIEKLLGYGEGLRRAIPAAPTEVWETTACPTLVRGGAVINQVPDEASLDLDIRYVPSDSPEAILARLAAAIPGARIDVLNSFPPMVCREDTPLVRSLAGIYRDVLGREPMLGREHGATDARYFSDRMDALIFGPSGEDLHGPDEWVSVASLEGVGAVLAAWGASLKG
jgi:succinyl-diaminopimelate desuccinylase